MNWIKARNISSIKSDQHVPERIKEENNCDQWKNYLRMELGFDLPYFEVYNLLSIPNFTLLLSSEENNLYDLKKIY